MGSLDVGTGTGPIIGSGPASKWTSKYHSFSRPVTANVHHPPCSDHTMRCPALHIPVWLSSLLISWFCAYLAPSHPGNQLIDYCTQQNARNVLINMGLWIKVLYMALHAVYQGILFVRLTVSNNIIFRSVVYYMQMHTACTNRGFRLFLWVCRC